MNGRTDRHDKANSRFSKFSERDRNWMRQHQNSQHSNYKSPNLTPRPRKSVRCNGCKTVVRERGQFCVKFRVRFSSVGCFCLITLLCQKLFILTQFEKNLRRLYRAFTYAHPSFTIWQSIDLLICKRMWHSTKSVLLHNGELKKKIYKFTKENHKFKKYYDRTKKRNTKEDANSRPSDYKSTILPSRQRTSNGTNALINDTQGKWILSWFCLQLLNMVLVGAVCHEFFFLTKSETNQRELDRAVRLRAHSIYIGTWHSKKTILLHYCDISHMYSNDNEFRFENWSLHSYHYSHVYADSVFVLHVTSKINSIDIFCNCWLTNSISETIGSIFIIDVYVSICLSRAWIIDSRYCS